MRTELDILPSVFAERMKNVFPPKRYHELMNTFAFKKPVSFRVNTSKVETGVAREDLIRARIKLFTIPGIHDAYYTFAPLGKIQKLGLYTAGNIYVQSYSSMLPALILKPRKDQTVLDMTAAPGSKTLQMSNLMGNSGLIEAYEKDMIRVDKLLYNINIQGAKNVMVRMGDATKIWKEYKEHFDKVLLDAPCSNESRFYIHERETFRHWNEDYIKRMSTLQKKLIASALVCLKVGGELVYSTCTFAPEENEEVIDWVVRMAGTQVTIENINMKLSNFSTPIRSWRKQTYSKTIRNAVRVLPTKIMGGFFICKIKKTASINI